jgi:hypothetical protein
MGVQVVRAVHGRARNLHLARQWPSVFRERDRLATSFLKFAQKERARILVLDTGAVTETDYARGLAVCPEVAGCADGGRAHRELMGRVAYREVARHSRARADWDGEYVYCAARRGALGQGAGARRPYGVAAQRPLQFEETRIVLPKSRTCFERRLGDQEKEGEVWTEPSLIHVSYVGEGAQDFDLKSEAKPDVEHGAPLTENLHTFAHQSASRIPRAYLMWWKIELLTEGGSWCQWGAAREGSSRDFQSRRDRSVQKKEEAPGSAAPPEERLRPTTPGAMQ